MTRLYPPAQPLPISKVLDASFEMFKMTFVRCLVFGPAWIILGQLPNIYLLATGKPHTTFGGGDPVWWVLYVVGALGAFVISAAMILHQRDIVGGLPSTALGKVVEAAPRLPALIGATLLTVLVLAGPSLLIGGPLFIGGTPESRGAATAVVVVVIALYLSFASLVVTVAWTALLVDKLSPVAALRYGLKLIKGNWWRTFVVLLVATIVTLVVYLVAFTVLVPLSGKVDVTMIALVTQLLIVALSALVAPYFGAIFLALYGDLKARREGTDLEHRIAAAARG